MKVAIFNAAGAVGARIVETFHLSGSPQPVALAATPAGLSRAGRFAVSLRLVDPGSAESLRSALAGCSALVFSPAEDDDPNRLAEVATALAQVSAEGAIRRLVMLSDAAPKESEGGAKDNAKPAPPGGFTGTRSAALAAAEGILLGIGGDQLPLTIVLRTGPIYGARAPAFTELARGLESGDVPTSHGNTPWNGLHIDNLVAAVRAALHAKAPDRRVFNLTDTGDLTKEAFQAAVAHELRAPTAEKSASSPKTTEGRGLRGQGLLAEKQLGYRPSVDLAEAIRRSCAWWRHTRD